MKTSRGSCSRFIVIVIIVLMCVIIRIVTIKHYMAPRSIALISLIAPSKMELEGEEYSRVGQKFVIVSKMKFHHPVLDTFSPRKSDHISLHKQHMDKLTCMPTDFQVDPSCDAYLTSSIWISSTIPADWIWQFPSEFEASSHQDVYCNKRQIVCEFEGDASINEIINQQLKNYSSLLKTRSKVKMVQSLVPIWEEYERT